MTTNPANKDDPAYDGNELFVQKKYDEALVAYSTAIEKYPKLVKLYSNRALTYLKLNRPYEALKDIEAGLKIEPTDAKLIYRKCTALLEMRRFPEAAQALDEGLKSMGSLSAKYETEFKTLIDDMDRLKLEFVHGRYDIMAMIEESKQSPFLVKHADFFAWNKFEIREIDGKGRGLIAKERIKLGELLIVCEAFAIVPFSGEDTIEMLADKVRKKLSHRPDLAQKFYRLYAGPELGHLDNWTEGESELVDLKRIKQVVRCNSYGDHEILGWEAATDDDHDLDICLIPSYINHTCVDFNIARYSVGNFTFIRATKVIDKGEELVIPWLSPVLPYQNRRHMFQLEGFECRCSLCQIESQHSDAFMKRLDEIRQYMDSAVDRLGADSPHRLNDTALVERFLDELRRNRQGVRIDYLTMLLREIYAALVYTSDAKASIPMWKQLVEDFKSVGDFVEAMRLTKRLNRVLMRAGSQRERDECKELARGIAKLFFDDERLAELYL